MGIDVLLLGAGPTGLILAQLLKLNGAHRVTIAANKGIKMDIAKKLNAADEYIELDRTNPAAQWEQLKKDNPYGFDVVVEATGVEKLAQDSINYVRRGGTIMIYGVYENKAQIHWPPSKIFSDEIKVGFQTMGQSQILTCEATDHWLVLAGVLLPSCSGIPGWWQGQRQGHGKKQSTHDTLEHGLNIIVYRSRMSSRWQTTRVRWTR